MKLASFLLDLFFPNFCLGCNRFDTLLCCNCYQKIQFLSLPVQLEIEPCYLDQVITMARYEKIVKKLIIKLKYQSLKKVGQLLGKMVVETTIFPQAELITAIPLSRKRLWQRGFNQAEVIARQISQQTGIKYLPLLIRTKHTSPQAKIKNKNKRLNHLRDCFKLNPQLNLNINKIKSQSILLVDDVITTGSTLNTAAKTLKSVGFKKVHALTIAHGA